jgi:hypothetical protein
MCGLRKSGENIMDKPRQQGPLYNVKNSEKKSTPQDQKTAPEFKAPFSKVSPEDDKKSPLIAAKQGDKPASKQPQQVQPQQQKPQQAAPGNDAQKGK